MEPALRVAELNNNVTQMIIELINGQNATLKYNLSELEREIEEITKLYSPEDKKGKGLVGTQMLEKAVDNACNPAKERDNPTVLDHKMAAKTPVNKNRENRQKSSNVSGECDEGLEMVQERVLDTALVEELPPTHEADDILGRHASEVAECERECECNILFEDSVIDFTETAVNTEMRNPSPPELISEVIETHLLILEPKVSFVTEMQSGIFEREQRLIDELMEQNERLVSVEIGNKTELLQKEIIEEKHEEMIVFDCNNINVDIAEQEPRNGTQTAYNFAALSSSFCHVTTTHEKDQTTKTPVEIFKYYYRNDDIISPKREIELIISGKSSKRRAYGVAGRPIDVWE